MKATVYYTRTNVSGFSYDRETYPYVDVRHYDNEGKFIQRTAETPKLENHYTKVGEVELPLNETWAINTLPKNVDVEIPSQHLASIFRFFNTVMPSEITKGIKIGAIKTEHSSMSVADVIEIDGHFFIVEGIGFRRLDENFNTNKGD